MKFMCTMSDEPAKYCSKCGMPIYSADTSKCPRCGANV